MHFNENLNTSSVVLINKESYFTICTHTCFAWNTKRESETQRKISILFQILKSLLMIAVSQTSTIELLLASEVLRTIMSYAASWNNNRTEQKIIPTRDSNHAPSAIRAHVLSQLD